MNRTTPTIVLTGGGSGGHITPLLSLAQELKAREPGCQIVYIGHKGDNFDSLKKRAGSFDFMVFISAGKFRRYHDDGFLSRLLDIKSLTLNLRDFFRFPGSIVSAYRVLAKFQPDVVFSKGGFVSVPVGLAAKLQGIPIVTHDSDTVPGLANRIVGRWAKVHATGMPAKYYDYDSSTTEYVGIPVGPEVQKVTPKIQKQARDHLKISEDAQILLLTGGGNGSAHLNNLMTAAAAGLLETNLALQIIHISGDLHEQEVKQAYRKVLPRPQQKRMMTLGFSTDFYNLTAAADLIMTRAGATTLAELSIEGKACIFIPAPFLADGHQLKNAEMIADADAGVVLEESVQPDELQAVINELLNDNSRRFELAKNLYGLSKPDAAGRLATIILNLAKSR